MKVDEYKVMAQAVEAGVVSGWRRAHKHVENPTPEDIQATIEQDVMNEICEWFSFDDGLDELV